MSQKKLKKNLLMTFDPGKKSTGVAIFLRRRLVACANVYTNVGGGAHQYRAVGHAVLDFLKENRPGRWPRTDACFAYEAMMARKNKPEAVPDLLNLSVVSGVVLGGACASEVREVTPGEWTGGNNKETNHPLIRKRLDEEELAILDKALARCKRGMEKEIYDAVGIGLYLTWRG